MFKKTSHHSNFINKTGSPINMKKQKGVFAIEFAALFVIFFTVLYAIIAYSLPLLLTLTFKQLSSDAGRAAIKVNRALPDAEYAQVVSREVNRVIQSSWLPSDWVTGNCPAPKDTSKKWSALPASEGLPSYGYLSKDNISGDSDHYRFILQVCVQRKYGSTGSSAEKAILPTIHLLGMKIPNIPEVDGEVVIRSQTTVRL